MSYPINAKRLLISLIAMSVMTIAYVACQKSYVPSGINPSPGPVVSTTFSLSGRITDKDHLPVAGASVKIAAAATTTDLNGNFQLSGVTVPDPKKAFVKVDKEGFFSGSRTFVTNTGSFSYVSLQLIKKVIAGNISGVSGGTVQIPEDGGSIQLPANGIVATGNAPYSGNVSVAAYFINPAAADFQEQMPGALRGVDNNNQETGLQSFGMMAIELSGAGNEKLQIATGKTATLTFPIQPGLQAQAPSTIPLWSFNDSTGLWKQEGTATRQGSNYVGMVNHFSFWNCDFPVPLVDFKGTIINQNGLPLSNVKVLLKTVDDAITTFGSGYSNSDGVITGLLPANRSLQVIIYNKCGAAIEIRNVGPFTTDANLGNLAVKSTTMTSVTFSGNVTNCTGTVVKDGFVDIAIENLHEYARVVNGTFKLAVSRCGSATTATVTAFDAENSTRGAPVNVSFADSIAATGDISACGNSASEYFNYTLDAAVNAFNNITDSIYIGKSNNSYLIWLSRKIGGVSRDDLTLSFPNTTTSVSKVTAISVNYNNVSYRLKSPATINITENGPAGGFIAGNFTADLKSDSTTLTYVFEARFRMKQPR